MNIGFITSGLKQPLCRHLLDRPAISLEDAETLTYRELDERVNRYANGLLELGAKPGERIAILLYNSLEYWTLYLAITKIRCIAVRLNFRLAAEELAYALEDSGTSILCLHDSFAGTIANVGGGPGLRCAVLFPRDGGMLEGSDSHTLLEYAEATEPPVEPATLADPAMLMYTSGTTGRPKGALWTHSNTVSYATQQIMFWGYDEDTVSLTTGPLYHVGAFENLSLPALFARGRTAITRSTGFSIERTMKVIEALGVTDTLLYPFMIYDLLQHPSFGSYDLSSLRRIVTGGSPIVGWAVEQLRRELPDVDLVPTYGLTEGGAISTGAHPASTTWDHPDSVGRPIPLTEVRIVGGDGEDVAAGESGEVWVRSPGVAREYWGRPQESAETFVDGWCITGDLGRVNDAGLLVITGRKKDMIKSGGENIYPAEIEQVLTRHPAIEDAAAIGVPDPTYQETVCVVVVPKRGEELPEEEVVEHCRRHLASYKKPRYVIVASELPRTASGKVMKHVLRERYAHLGSERAADGGQRTADPGERV
jgi:fatty-acyl-CoA synthase